jgi:hypothetical protein
MMAVVVLDVELAGHLALALSRYRDELARRGYTRPAGLIDLEAAARHVVETDMRGEAGANGGADRGSAGSPAYGCERHGLLTQKHFAAALGWHPRTVRRWLDLGEVRCVTVNGRRRIPVSELDRLQATSEEAS